MKLTTRGRYSLHCMVAVARLAGAGSPVKLEAVAASTGLSIPYLRQITIALRKADLLRGVAGRSGGYVLTRDPGQITVAEIIEAGIGPISVVDCVCEPEYCAKAEGCETRLIYVLLNRSITKLLASYTLADLCDVERLAAVVEVLDDRLDERATGDPSSPSCPSSLKVRGRHVPSLTS